MPEAVESRAVNRRLCDFFPPQQKVRLLGCGTVGLLTENSR